MESAKINKLVDFDIPEEYLKSPKLQSMLSSLKFLINNRDTTNKQIELEIDSARTGNKQAKMKVLDWKIRLKVYETSISKSKSQIHDYCIELAKQEQELNL